MADLTSEVERRAGTASEVHDHTDEVAIQRQHSAAGSSVADGQPDPRKTQSSRCCLRGGPEKKGSSPLAHSASNFNENS